MLLFGVLGAVGAQGLFLAKPLLVQTPWLSAFGMTDTVWQDPGDYLARTVRSRRFSTSAHMRLAKWRATSKANGKHREVRRNGRAAKQNETKLKAKPGKSSTRYRKRVNASELPGEEELDIPKHVVVQKPVGIRTVSRTEIDAG
ncbi:hypothetical protein QFC20_002889 [Naganishia adeliensis]|uniref:Uncharacterized protein n=1 Tax=Naganishia adeliensis TaxID=92952 RepID=A0ACC2WFM1_9TREE|nr:hypothetical protein QFC20_002889 [Naganishia adeliensis]